MRFKKGQIVYYSFPTKTKNKTKVLFGEHMAVVLHSRETPYRTLLIAPITSLENLKKSNKIPENYLKLEVSKYSSFLKHDSYVNLDMIISVDGNKIDAIEINSKKINAHIDEQDEKKLDYKIALTYELQKYFNDEHNKEMKQEINNILEYIDINIKEKVKMIKGISKNEELLSLIFDIIDNDLVNILKDNYLQPIAKES
ncbi:type II toxin-antitoxin system PemK/MazF family toxin [Clostridium botulinum]|uniref:Type II toxin-antitoxin system PemK/MazF family toxin n=2 Tax=Clostridium botulinum TaxID=1491 RepID=A0A9Q1UX12_CLOBO|nr:type II toxin-antitoxin system PemK/MazF family toxin [Clostridium botulinum]AEB77341.1 conserved hypothetical protein [Clostridium botulinum BKT015925]KEH96329.1 hypothetical protein Y848_13695 [Clostridium botulinum C/D str. Sp77]KLU74433.1 hypothetical protein CBC3_p0138 [Clostridium botulinum V891]KOA79540.1 hypothetical protein ADU77_03950 [Clostridium botulinum]KOA85005.1 hypothetical protein ADU74_10060 [Clostridium botulinum]